MLSLGKEFEIVYSGVEISCYNTGKYGGGVHEG
jgi:hypothetical protein